MGTILTIILPIFAIIALGWTTTRIGLFSAADMRVFGRFVMNIALPALLFNALASRDLEEVLNPPYLISYSVISIAMVALSLLWFKQVRGFDLSRAAICVMGTACSNSGYFVFPILTLALPHMAPLVLAMSMIVENLLVLPLCLILSAAGSQARQGGLGALIRHILRDLVRRPLMVSMLAGLVWSLLALPWPEIPQRAATMIATASVPLALFVIGGSLAGVPFRGNLALASQVTVLKLLVHPLLAMALLAGATFIGLPELDPMLRSSLLITTAVPMIGVYPIFAQEHGMERMAALAMLLATVASFFTLSLVLLILI
ncbi:MAG: AEC family transporter [Pseudorhodobacter sp.]